MDIHGKRVTVVVAGAGARGGYEAGALSVLVPRLRAAGYEPTVYIGTSAGAINVTLFAAFADLPAAEQADQVLGQWRRISVADIYRSPILTFPASRPSSSGSSCACQVCGSHTCSTLLRWKSWCKLHQHRQAAREHSREGLTVAVVATSGDDNRSVVFVDRRDSVPVPASDDERPIDYVGVEMQPKHVLASSAIPALFPAVPVEKPSASTGWFLDGGLRLNAPLKPARSLAADALAIVATHPMRDPLTSLQAPSRPM
jgi:NTE family protein